MFTRLAVVAVLTGLLTIFSGPAAAGEQLIIDGTGDSQQLLRVLAVAFEKNHPDIQVIVPDSIGSTGGVKSLIEGRCGLARTARPLKEREIAGEPKLRSRAFALSPVVFAANLPTPCLPGLTTDQVVGIFSGRIGDWSQLAGCPAHKIYVAQREEGDSSRTIIEKNIPEFKEIEQLAGETVYSTPETLTVVTRHAFTVAYLPMAVIQEQGLQVFALNGKDPDPINIRNGAYPLAVQFALVWKEPLTGIAEEFAGFVFGPDGQKIIRENGMVAAAGD